MHGEMNFCKLSSLHEHFSHTPGFIPNFLTCFLNTCICLKKCFSTYILLLYFLVVYVHKNVELSHPAEHTSNQNKIFTQMIGICVVHKSISVCHQFSFDIFGRFVTRVANKDNESVLMLSSQAQFQPICSTCTELFQTRIRQYWKCLLVNIIAGDSISIIL